MSCVLPLPCRNLLHVRPDQSLRQKRAGYKRKIFEYINEEGTINSVVANIVVRALPAIDLTRASWPVNPFEDVGIGQRKGVVPRFVVLPQG